MTACLEPTYKVAHNTEQYHYNATPFTTLAPDNKSNPSATTTNLAAHSVHRQNGM